MALSKLHVQLLIGRVLPKPAPSEITRAIEAIELKQDDDGGPGFNQGFQMTLRVDHGKAPQNAYPLTTNPLLRPGNRMVCSVTLNGTPRVLFDGVITQQQFTPAVGGQSAKLSLNGKDLSLLMDLDEIGLVYPGLNHTAIALLIIAKYAMYGIVPLVIPPLADWSKTPLQNVPYHKGTDRAFLRELAGEHGYYFGVRAGPLPGMNLAYWGPLIRIGDYHKPLTVDMGPGSNVESIQFDYDAEGPTAARSSVSVPVSPVPIPVMSLYGGQIPPFALDPITEMGGPLKRTIRLKESENDPIAAFARAQAILTKTTARTVNASGSLDVQQYQDMLAAPGLVKVRGAGHAFDGLYYVKSVTHRIRPEAYKQQFTLSREGTGNLEYGV